MAAVADLGLGTSDRSVAWRAELDRLIESFDDAPIGQVQSFCAGVRSKVDAFEARRLAAAVDGDDAKASARIAARSGKRSKAQARRAAKRAAAVKKNPDLGDRLDNGDLSTEQVDTIADASARSQGQAACDQELIDAISAAGVDQGRKLADEWLRQRADRDRVNDEHDRQRRQRRASSYFDSGKGLRAFKLEGDNASLAELWSRIELRERAMWQAEGGRDVSPGEHPRTRDQRLFDAAVELILGLDSGSSSEGAGRPAVVINVDGSGSAPAEMVGHGPIPDSVAAEILSRSNLFVNIGGLDGKTMWWGRGRRRASMDQFIALVARDRGCVLCGASWLGCEAHHRMPWNAPGQGETNLDEMVLLCVSCHHDVHAHKRTVIAASNGTWTTRAAWEHEVAPARPSQTPRGDRRSAQAAPPVATTRRANDRSKKAKTSSTERSCAGTGDRGSADDEAA